MLGRELPDAAAETLVAQARERGGEDNITVAIVQHGPRAAVVPAAVAPATEVDDEAHTRTIARPRPAPVGAPAVVPAAVLAAPTAPRLWPTVLFLTVVMILLIFLLWVFIQRATTL